MLHASTLTEPVKLKTAVSSAETPHEIASSAIAINLIISKVLVDQMPWLTIIKKYLTHGID